jgi:peptidyl-prolyl cis-trans isomerase SurA
LDGENGKQVLVQVYNVLEPTPKRLNECRGLVTSAYQDYLEQEWINNLRETYRFEVYEDVFESINNN